MSLDRPRRAWRSKEVRAAEHAVRVLRARARQIAAVLAHGLSPALREKCRAAWVEHFRSEMVLRLGGAS